MSIKTVIQDVFDQHALGGDISQVVGSEDLLVRRMRSLIESDLLEEMQRFSWVQLERQFSIALVAGEEAYALPGDFDSHISNTQWDSSNQWPLVGPTTPSEWQRRKNGVVSTTPRRRWRVRGVNDKQLLIHDTPGSSDAGETLVFEYLSSNLIRPRSWEQGQSYQSGSYTFHDGNYYIASDGGTTGAIAPVHLTGSNSDGGVDWEFFSGKYSRFTADTDEFVIPEHLALLGLKFLWSQSEGLPFEFHQARFEKHARRHAAKKRGAKIVYMGGASSSGLLVGPWNVPDGNYNL